MAQDLGEILILIGAVFVFIAAIGVVRLPDLFMRMHASTKSATLGAGCIMVGAALYFGDISISTRALAVVIFLFITAPIGAHMIARSAYFSGVPLWHGTLSDDLRGHYDMLTHQLIAEEETPAGSEPETVSGR
jgi:multicomponent Na+:H+ antiporter subunit G